MQVELEPIEYVGPYDGAHDAGGQSDDFGPLELGNGCLTPSLPLWRISRYTLVGYVLIVL